jgi:teichuronic acid biosynthesis glycosyltransferase TuaG
VSPVAEPRVSVVIPTHQAAGIIAGTIRCVLEQTYQDFEVVVVDNGSTDGTEQVVAALGDPRIRYRWQEDSGLPANSRNVGVGMARGELVAFLDADDVWYPEKLARVVAAFDADPALTLVCHDVNVTQDGRVLKVRGYSPDTSRMHEQLLYVGNFVTTSATTVRRQAVMDAGGFDEREDYVTVEDYDLWLKIADRRGRFLFLREVLGEYVQYAGSLSKKLERHYDNLLRVVDAHLAEEAARGRLDVYRAWRRAVRSQGGLVRDLWRNGSYRRALVRALRLVPFAVERWLHYRSLAASGASSS